MFDGNDFSLNVIKETLNQKLGTSFMFLMAFAGFIPAYESNFITLPTTTNKRG
jgi:hypothetical protein